jgi:hypothetical protein
MRIVKIISVVAIVAVLLYVFLYRNNEQEITPTPEGNVEIIEEPIHNHDHEEENIKPFYQGEIISIEHGGAYTYLEILEKTEMSFWIVVDKVDAKKGDFVMFQEDLVAENFHSKALDKTFDEIMFATNLQYRVKE